MKYYNVSYSDKLGGMFTLHSEQGGDLYAPALGLEQGIGWMNNIEFVEWLKKNASKVLDCRERDVPPPDIYAALLRAKMKI